MTGPFRGRLARALALAASGFACAAPPAHADVWRCGNSYSDRPCSGGSAIEAPPAPSDAQRRQAEQATRRNQAAAERMRRERQRLEAAGARRGALVIGPPPKPPAQKKAKKASKSRDKNRPYTLGDDFVATHQTAPAKKSKSKSD